MAQLNQILWSNITWGFSGICFLLLFGIAIKFEWNSQLTPKAWNRPRNVLKNVLKRHKLLGCINFYPLSWCLWASRLSHEEAMGGIPGTGTRDDGWTGPTLKTTLDGVILLRFHRMLFKVGVLATLLSCGVLLPVYTSSVCDPTVVGERECRRLASLTDFENMTISHVPEVRGELELELDENANNSNSNDDDDEFERLVKNATLGAWNENEKDEESSGRSSWFLGSWFPPRQEEPSESTPVVTETITLNKSKSKSSHNNNSNNNNRNNRNNRNNNKPQLIDEEGNIIIPPEPVATRHTATSKWVPGISWRHMTTALCSVLIYIYTCYLLWHEWIENLALRKVHFLESDHYPKRMQELDDIANLQTKPEDPVIAKRPPFVPHPEMREVPPSVGLYSVLYQLPKTLVTFDTDGATQVDRQLVATVHHFHESVEARPGFTSSVVAATLVPDAGRVSRCWITWYKLESKVRMVRYVRKIVRSKQEQQEHEQQQRLLLGGDIPIPNNSNHVYVYGHVAQALKTSNHAVKTVAQRAYKRVSKTASEALQKGAAVAAATTVTDSKILRGCGSGSDATDATNATDGVELTSLAASSSIANREEEQTPLVVKLDRKPSFRQQQQQQQQQKQYPSSNNPTLDTDSSSSDSENDDVEEDGSGSEIGFWQNFFGGGSSPRHGPNPFKDKDKISDSGDLMPADFEDDSFVGGNSIGGGGRGGGDIELQLKLQLHRTHSYPYSHSHSSSTFNDDQEQQQQQQQHKPFLPNGTANGNGGKPKPLKLHKSQQRDASSGSVSVGSSRSRSGNKFCGALTHGFKYENYDVKQYAQTISHGEETELIDIVDGLGIEELSVFAREYAQSSSSPFPLGCFPNSLKALDIDELRELEEDLWADIRVLNEELLRARENVVKLDDDFEVEPTMISTAATAAAAASADNNDDVVVVDLENGGGSRSSPSCSAPWESSLRSSRKNDDGEILLDSPRSQRSFPGLCKLRNRGTHNHQHGEKVPVLSGVEYCDDDGDDHDYDSEAHHHTSARDGSEPSSSSSQLSLAKRMAIALPANVRGKLATMCCGGKYNPIFQETINNLPKYYGHVKGAGRAFVNALDHPSYAVVTFSSRQAAIEARQFLSDNHNHNHNSETTTTAQMANANHSNHFNNFNSWQQIDEIPIPPLADAPPRKMCFCRGCCRPVTLTINYKEKKCRRWSVYVFMLFFCCFYTIPLAFISLVLNPRWLGQFFPNSKSLHDPNNILYRALAGPASGLATTLFMALLPQIFKSIAFYEGTSSSLEMAERKALIFMWYFMLVTAFFGQYLATMLLQWYYHAGVTHITQSLWSTVNTVATLIPSAIAPQWLNWIIIRYGFIWPGGYFFQMNTFLTKISGLTCINRVVRGGGAGGPTPFRIYVDSGIVLLCIVGLSPMVPIVAPIATIYFIVVQPMLRWLLIFVYRPRYDTGGERWPLCHQIVISSLIMAQILTSVTLALKGSLGGAVMIGCCTFPTFMFSLWTEERFLRPYKDTALLQTSRLDAGQDSYNDSQREEFRRWLVDCHKASYVPMCLLGSKENLLTVEPAVVIPKGKQGAEEELSSSSTHSTGTGPRRRRKQKGGIYDRKHR